MTTPTARPAPVMPYQRRGAMKISSHEVRSPLESISASCQTCHGGDEEQLRAKVEAIQGRTERMRQRAAEAMTAMLDAVLGAKAAGASEEELAPVYELQRKAMWRLDFVSSENSAGFHADQEAMRILGESIDYSRQAQAAALHLHGFEVPAVDDLPREPIQGVTPREGPADRDD